MKTGRPPKDPIIRFESKFKKTKGCWVWMGAITSRGYGQFRFGCEQRAHRASYILYKGKIPSGLLVLHSCDNPPCVNPDHLFLGTPKDNTTDMIKKNRDTIRGEKNNKSKLTEKDVLEIRRLYKSGKYTLVELAKIYKMYMNSIWRITSKESWKHI